ncbi:MAG TPA: hypothetical protein VLV48_03160, partial [Thermoanaerobaculia bacterium]|nr:hypothetical protein [Thermoanaerobaculia bacterium]
MKERPRGSNLSQTTLSQIRQIASGAGAAQRRTPRHSQQYQLHPPVRPTDGTAERPATPLGMR